MNENPIATHRPRWWRKRRKRAEPEDIRTIIERAVRDGIALAATGAVYDAVFENFKAEWHPARRALVNIHRPRRDG